MSLTIIVLVVLAMVLLKFATKFTSKILGIVFLVVLGLGFMYYQSIGPFKENVADLAHLEQKYCEDNYDDAICDCILSFAKKDMKERFTKVELESLSYQKFRAAYVLQKSLKATKEEAMACLLGKGQPKKYTEFLQDFVPIENKYLDLIGDKAKQVGEKLKEEINSFKLNKDGIDGRY